MRFDSRNRSLIIAHGLKTNTSKDRAFSALVAGVCCGCSNDVNVGDTIVWNRKYGIFHKSPSLDCITDREQSGGVTLDQVRSEIRSVISGTARASVDTEILRALIVDVMQEERPSAVIEFRNLSNDTVVKIAHAHVMLRKVLTFVVNGDHVYLYGPPGSGKSTGAKHAADALARRYGYISLNPQTPDSRLLGFMQPQLTGPAVFVPTEFYECYTKGGVFCIDEMDNASASLLTTLNSAFENATGAFPCGNVDKHPNFVCIATGNTTGRGGNAQFPERRVFDAAFAERFVFVLWDYDERMERAVALTINSHAAAWINWVQRVRVYAKQNDPRIVVSPRATFKISKYLLTDLTPAEILEGALFKGIEPQRVERILNANPIPA